MYSAAFEKGLAIELDQFGGFKLTNRGAITFKAGEIDVTLGLLCKLPTDKLSENFSVMEKDQAMLGVARFANHCCAPTCDFNERWLQRTNNYHAESSV